MLFLVTKFNPHLHILISVGALSRGNDTWIADAGLHQDSIMQWWRFAVVTLLGMAHQEGLLQTDLPRHSFAKLINAQYRRSWHVSVDSRTKGQILRYAGRYLRRPPVAEHRILEATSDHVTFLAKLRDRPGITTLEFSLHDFIERLSHHVPNRCAHGVRYFGLLAPRAKARVYDLVFHELRQQRRPKPPRLHWATSIRKSFGIDPLLDSHGHRMHWVGQILPTGPSRLLRLA